MDNLDPDFGKFLKPAPRHSLKPLGSSNSLSSYDRKGGYYGNQQKSPPSVRKTLFESRNKENDESMLCKDFTDREVTGKSPIVVPLTRSKKSESFAEVEEKRVKPRRSMLGLRSKLLPSTYSKDDTTFTLSKPLHSSSPNSESLNSSREESRSGQRLHKATSSPSLNNPFDNCDADMSSFFTKGISDSSTWSVFKSNKTSGKSTNYLQETPLTRASIGSSRFQNDKSNMVQSSWMETHNSTYSKETEKNAVTADQKMQLEWLSMKFQTGAMLSDSVSDKKLTGNRTDHNPEPRKSYRNDKPSSLKHETEELLTYGARTRAQAKKEREKCLGGSKRVMNTNEAISPIPKKEDSEGDNKSANSITISDNDSSQDDSMDSYVQNEATIIGTCKKQFKDTGEECLSNLTGSSRNEDVCSEQEDCSDEYLSTNEDSPDSSTLVNKIFNLMCDLKTEKEELNLKYTAYLEQKDRYEKKMDSLMTCLEKMKNNFKGGETKTKTYQPEKSKTQKNGHGFSFPSNSTSKQPLVVSKQFSGLKANFNCLKTPIRSNDKIKQIRKSVCYTPNSLSVLVGDQVQDIFGDM